MNIGVCIKVVPDYEVSLDKFQLENNRMSGEYKDVIGLYDEHAIEVALQLKSSINAKLYAVSYGQEKHISTLKKALSMGADELILVRASVDDPLQTAYNLARVISTYNMDLVLLGRVSSDLEREMVPGFMAGILNWVYLPYTISISQDPSNNCFICTQQLDNNSLISRVGEKFVASVTDAPCNLPRIPNLKEIMKSKAKPIHIMEEEHTRPFEWAQEISVTIPHYEYINETLPNEDLNFTAKLLIENLKKEHYI
jgi:electron transfer flavoprotein beta subunit